MDSQLHACKPNIHLDIAIKAAHEGEYFESDDIHTIMKSLTEWETSFAGCGCTLQANHPTPNHKQ